MQRRYFLKTIGGMLAGCACGIGHARADGGTGWSYGGETGPENWGTLNVGFGACGLGDRQSPIDISGAETANLPGPEIVWRSPAGELVNNGRTIKIVPADGGAVSFEGEQFRLLQAHFHAPSEHRVNGRSFPMEAHFVHRHETTGELVVLGVFLEGGARHADFSALMRAFPAAEGEHVPVPDGIDLNTLLPRRRAYWRYSGSLTSPPCDETVRWVVFQEPVGVGDADIERFRAVYPMNARPAQPLKGRSIFVSD